MAESKTGGIFRRPFSRAQRPLFSWENYRLLFSVVFWLMLTVTYLGYAISFLGQYVETASRPDTRLSGLLWGTLAFAAVAVAWHLLPWDLGTNRRRLLAVPLFLASVFWANYSLVAIDRAFYWPLFLMVFAHGVFLFGPRRSILYAGMVLALILVYLQLTGDDSLLSNVVLLILISPSVAFFIVACAAILEATRRRRESQDLLEELRSSHAELESAHLELGRYAARVRELSISEERTRMAREIHDSLGHYLTAISLQLDAAGKTIIKGPERARGQVDKARGLASEALSEVRRSVRALKPLAVEERSGTGAFRALVRSFEGTGFVVSFGVKGEERELSSERELVLYRALQEGLTNASRYSQAHRVSSLLFFEPEGVRLEVADDGEGAPEGFMEGGFGLSALEERVEALGGSMRAGNAAEGGFLLEVGLPTDGPTGATP